MTYHSILVKASFLVGRSLHGGTTRVSFDTSKLACLYRILYCGLGASWPRSTSHTRRHLFSERFPKDDPTGSKSWMSQVCPAERFIQRYDDWRLPVSSGVHGTNEQTRVADRPVAAIRSRRPDRSFFLSRKSGFRCWEHW